MFRRIVLSLSIATVLLLPLAPAEAGPFGFRALSGAAGPGMGRRQPPSAEQLGLTPAQSAEWQAIRRDAKALRAATLDQLEAELDDAADALARPDANLPAKIRAWLAREAERSAALIRALKTLRDAEA